MSKEKKDLDFLKEMLKKAEVLVYNHDRVSAEDLVKMIEDWILELEIVLSLREEIWQRNIKLK